MVSFLKTAQASRTDNDVAQEFVSRLKAAGFGGGNSEDLAAPGADPWAAFETGRGRHNTLAPKK